MAAGTQAQGVSGDEKGKQVAKLIQDLMLDRVRTLDGVESESDDGSRVVLSEGRELTFGSEPDVSLRKGDRMLAAIEI